MKTDAIEHQIEVYRGYAATYQEGSSDRRDCTEAADQMEAELKAIETALAVKDEALRQAVVMTEKAIAYNDDVGQDVYKPEHILPYALNGLKAALSPQTGKALVDVEKLRKIRDALHMMWDNPESMTPSDMMAQYTDACEMLDESIDV